MYIKIILLNSSECFTFGSYKYCNIKLVWRYCESRNATKMMPSWCIHSVDGLYSNVIFINFIHSLWKLLWYLHIWFRWTTTFITIIFWCSERPQQMLRKRWMNGEKTCQTHQLTTTNKSIYNIHECTLFCSALHTHYGWKCLRST